MTAAQKKITTAALFAVTVAGVAGDVFYFCPGKPRQWFQRDAVHGDDRGKQIVGRIVEAYFRP